MGRFGKPIVTLLIIACIAVVIFGIIYLISSKSGEGVGVYSEGIITGYVFMLTSDGTFKTSLEGSLLVGNDKRGFNPSVSGDNVTGDTKSFSNVFRFSVTKATPGLKEELEDAITKGKRVVLRFKEPLSKGYGVSTNYVVTECTLVD